MSTWGARSRRRFITYILLWLLFASAAAGPAIADGPAPINELFFKGTHNSYACRNLCDWGIANTCPVIHHPPGECSDLWTPCYNQIDDFGVWAIELDFSIDGAGRFIVGHNGPESPEESWTNASWGPGLREYFTRIRNTMAFEYRPVFIFLEKKGWGKNPPLEQLVAQLEGLLEEVFNTDGGDHIFGPEDLMRHGGAWPTVPELAGMVVPILLGKSVRSSLLFYTDNQGTVKYKDPSGVEHNAGLRRGPPHDTCGDNKRENLEREANDRELNFSVMDMYQYDWTFLGPGVYPRWAPPNPIVVDHAAPQRWTVRNNADPEGTGECWKYQYCGNWCDEIPSSFTVTQHGTFGFPFDRVSVGVDFARSGWTVLIRAGHYPERLTIRKRLILKAEGGTVVIGSRH